MKNLMRYSSLALALMVAQPAMATSVWGRIKNAFNDCSFSDKEREEVYKMEMMTTAKLPEYFKAAFSEADFQTKPWMRDFRYVIVVNKSERGASAQTMRVYEYTKLVHKAKVSTGRENLELRRKNPVCAGAPLKSYWSQTPTGYYTPKFLSKDHKSSSWDSDMPFAIFFDIDNGLALHQVYKKYESLLGSRASGGCVRQDPESAEELFNRVKETEYATIPEVNVDGTPVLNADGTVKYINQQEWTNKLTGAKTKFNTFGTLIIIEDVNQ